MAILERDVIQQGVDENGNSTIDFPLARLGWIEDTAEIKAAPGPNDYIPIVDVDDQGQMKKTPAAALGGSGAAQYDTAASYAVGDYCTKDGKLYRCTSAVTAGAAWDAASWQETSVARELAAVRAAAGEAVPITRKVNGKALSTDISLSAGDVGAAGSSHTHTASDVGAVPTSRTVNGKALSADITLSASDVGAAAANHTHTASEVGAVPTSRTVNGKALSANITLSASNVGAAESNHTHTPLSIGAAPSSNPVFTGSISMDRSGDRGLNSVALGSWATASGDCSCAVGQSVTASGNHSCALGSYSKATGPDALAEGLQTTASGECAHAEGAVTTANNYAGHAGGHFNKDMVSGGSLYNTVGDAMVIGNGSSGSNGALYSSNCFRVTYSGYVYGLASFKSSGADYAEFFEWADGNPDGEERVGYFVTLDGKHIRPAVPGDYILGVVSGQPCIIGNADEDWLGRWEHDEFGRFVLEYLEEEETELSTEGLSEEEITALRLDLEAIERNGKLYRVTAKVVDHETPSWRYKANPEYDSTQPYIERQDRPEWSAVGMLGVLPVRDDGTCSVNGFCTVAEGGIATRADGEFSIADGQIRKAYRVLERVAENAVKIIFR